MQFLSQPEPAEQFKARIQASIDAYEGTLSKGGKEGQGPPPLGFPGEAPPGGKGMDSDEEWTGPFHKVSCGCWLAQGAPADIYFVRWAAGRGGACNIA